MFRTQLAAAVFVWCIFGVATCQERPKLHRIDLRSPEQLRELLRFDAQPLPLFSAHRGGAMPGFPENCIETFEHTLLHAFSMLEIDLQHTQDGHIVLMHDTTLDRTTNGSGPVAEKTLAQLSVLHLKDNSGNITNFRIPTLDQVIEWARGKTVLILDKKNVSIEDCVQKIKEHKAQAFAMVMAYSFEDCESCHQLDPNIMMEVMIGTPKRFKAFDETGVPWNCIIAFVGHNSPNDNALLEQIHSRGTLCMAGTSRNLDLQLRNSSEDEAVALKRGYQSLLEFGVDVIETDLPAQLGPLLYPSPEIPPAKARMFGE